jgi:hypothetical protein
MADPKGFLTTPKQLAERRPVDVRIKDWNEVYVERSLLPIITKQAGRCMDCGIPFCHNGCPLGNLIPEWNDLAYREDWTGAIERLHATNNFPEFTGRLCPAPCESACVLGINQDPVTIKNVEVTIIDKAWDNGGVAAQPPDRPDSPPPSSSPGPATPWWCTSAPTASAGCCATASPSSRWRSATSTGASSRCAPRAPGSAPGSRSAST